MDKIVFFKGDEELFTAKLIDNLYVIDLGWRKTHIGAANSATPEVWHSKFGHVSMDTIKLMIKNNVVDGLKIQRDQKEVCEDCSLNKCTRVNHPRRTTEKAKQPGLVLHMDTAGPSNVISRGNSTYFVLCKDEFSKYRQVVFVQMKTEIPDKVKGFIASTILETGNQVFKIVTDNETEFKNEEVQGFLRSRGILHDLSVAYAPSQNGLIERDIRTIKESARTLLNNSKLEKELWPEAISCAVYALNRLINMSNPMKTPFELWFGRRPNVKNLRTFGELAILKKPDSLIKGWEEKGMKGIFLNYGGKFNTYKFLCNDKLVMACDVVFLNKMWDGEQLPDTQRGEVDDFWVSNGEIADRDEHESDDDTELGPGIDICPPGEDGPVSSTMYEQANDNEDLETTLNDEESHGAEDVGPQQLVQITPPSHQRCRHQDTITVRSSPRGIFRPSDLRFYINEGREDSMKV